MWHHQLWRGLRQYGWVAKALVGIAIVLGLYIFSEASDWYDKHPDTTALGLIAGTDSMAWRLITDFYESLSDGTLNFVALILLEVVIYHFMRQTLRILLARDSPRPHEFQPFLAAQWRMILFTFAAGFVQKTLLFSSQIVLDEEGWLYAGLSAVVHATFLGAAVADNYYEQFGYGITESMRMLYRRWIGLCFGLGLPLMVMLQVPVLGTVLGPLVTAVTAAIVLREMGDAHLVPAKDQPESAPEASRSGVDAGAELIV